MKPFTSDVLRSKRCKYVYIPEIYPIESRPNDTSNHSNNDTCVQLKLITIIYFNALLGNVKI